MGFKDMMKSFLYETVEDEDDYEEDARPAPRRTKGKNNSSRRSR